MLREQRFFRNFWRIIDYFGVYHYKLSWYEKIRSILYFFSNFVVNLALYFTALIVYDDPRVRINVLQTLPFFMQMLIDGSNFAAKCRIIRSFYNRLDEALDTLDSERHFRARYKMFLAYATFSATLGFGASLGGILHFLISGTTAVLIYTPYDHGLGFFAIWFVQTSFLIYSGILNFLLDAFMDGLLVALSAYVKALRSYVCTKGMMDLREIVELDLKLREFIKTYENLYSTPILFRGIVSILSLSSMVFEILNEDTEETANFVMFGVNLLVRFLVPSFFGNEIQLDCAQLLDDIYSLDWIGASMKERKNFILVQENLKNDYRLMAAKIFPINLHTFQKIIQSGYSFYAVLKQVKD